MTKSLQKLDIVLSIFNQQNLVERVLYGIFSNTTTPFNLILIFDGCTDKTEIRASAYIKKYRPRILQEVIISHAPNVYETRANNIGFKLAKEDFMITLQDDMVIKEYGWERRLSYPLRKFSDVIAVSSRTAQDIKEIDGVTPIYSNQMSREYNTLSRDTFAVRDVINRGPIAFAMKHLRNMDFLNEEYSPSDLDDADLCLRAWKKYRLRSGSYWINYISPLHWGKTRMKDSTMQINGSISKNSIRLAKDHGNYIATNIKHDENIYIPENEIDYIDNRPYYLVSFLYRPIRIHEKEMKRQVRVIIIFFKNITLSLCEIFGVKKVQERGIKKIITFKK